MRKPIILLLLSTLSLAMLGCQKPVDQPATKDGAVTAVSATSSTSLTLPNTATVTTSATATTARPVDYPFKAWQQQPIAKLSLKDMPALLAVLGTVQSTDPKSLDYAGNIANKYRFSDEAAPYLELIDSPHYLELGWYYANPTDSDREKATSVSHASKAYQMAQGLFGNEGGVLMQDILSGEIVKDKGINGKNIALAKCEFFSCQIIIKK